MFAAEGAKVVVNDLGGARRHGRRRRAGRSRSSTRSRRRVARPSPTPTTCRTGRAPSGCQQPPSRRSAISHVVVNNAGILRDRMLVNMTEEEWDAVIKVHLKGTFAPTRWAAAYWREQAKAGSPLDAPHRQHLVGVGPLRQPRPDELRRRQVGHRHLHPDRGARSWRTTASGQRHRAGCAHPHDRRADGCARAPEPKPRSSIAALPPTSPRSWSGSAARCAR